METLNLHGTRYGKASSKANIPSPLVIKASKLASLFESIQFHHIYRELNRVVDLIAKEVVDPPKWYPRIISNEWMVLALPYS